MIKAYDDRGLRRLRPVRMEASDLGSDACDKARDDRATSFFIIHGCFKAQQKRNQDGINRS